MICGNMLTDTNKEARVAALVNTLIGSGLDILEWLKSLPQHEDIQTDVVMDG